MIWAIYCVDTPDSRARRDAHRKAHRAYLDTYLSRIFFSGPIWDDEAFDQRGSIFLIDLNNRAEAEEFVANEPYYNNGVFASVMINRMTKGKYNAHLCPESRERPDLPKAVEELE